MAHPLELAYNWRLPLTFSTVGLSICIGVLLPVRDGSGVVTVVLVVLWAAFMVLLWVRTRAYLMVDGPRLRVRSAFALHEVEAGQVTAVRQHSTPHGPARRLTVRSPGGGSRRITVPTSLLRSGDATLFGWIMDWAPEAILDDGSLRTLARLRTRGLVG